MVAQTVVPQGFAAWIGCAAFVLLFLNQLYVAKKNLFGSKQATEISPQPLDVRIAHEFVRKDECVQRHGESTNKIQDIERQITALRSERADDLRVAAAGRKALYEKIEAVRKDVVGQLAGIFDKIDDVRKEASEHSENSRRELTEKIDDLPNQVIATLKNTGAI